MHEHQEDLINVDMAVTLDGLFNQRVRRSPEATAYRHFDRAAQRWLDINWRQTAERVMRWRAALAGEALSAGARVAVQMRNGLDWVCFDQAALAEGLVPVPLYTDDRPDNVAYILGDAAVRLLLLQNLAQWRKLAPALKGIDCLQRVVIRDAPDEGRDAALAADRRVRFLTDWLPTQFPPRPARVGDAHALASIVYTSGTTGRPKGVMLSHYNMLSVAHAVLAAIEVYPQDLFLSFLPLSHTLERTAGYYLPMMAGACVAHARSVGQLADDLRQVKPSVLIAVPRVFERIHRRLLDRLEADSPLTRGLFRAAVASGWHEFLRRQGDARWRPDQLFHPLLRRLVGAKVRAGLGGRLRYAVSGGAPLPLYVARTFIGLGLEILQGYGLTETSPVISVNLPEYNDPASVGAPLRGIETRIGADDELLVKTPGATLGYWNNHAATAELIDADGWLHTGDQARISRGRIYITGRLKDILVMSNGEKIPPADLEGAICADPLFDQALVVGEGRPCLGAVLVLNPERWFGFVKELGLDPYATQNLCHPRVHKRVLARIKTQLHVFPGYARIRCAVLSLDPWTVDNNLLTPTLKLRRSVLLQTFAARIDSAFASVR